VAAQCSDLARDTMIIGAEGARRRLRDAWRFGLRDGAPFGRVVGCPARAGTVRAGAVLVDIRPQINRDFEGGLPGAAVIDRNVLDWRLDPASDARLPIAGYDLHVIVVCNEGYASSLAAAALQNLGIQRATDLVGGYRAWRAAGLPTTEPAEPIDTRRTRPRSRSRPA
jgi:rhodanese-related sulfurtransferase